MKSFVGILALQGSFVEHARVLEKIGVKYLFVRTKFDLKDLTHLIIPGGESTTMKKLLNIIRRLLKLVKMRLITKIHYHLFIIILVLII